jgi:hypothetical protein
MGLAQVVHLAPLLPSSHTAAVLSHCCRPLTLLPSFSHCCVAVQGGISAWGDKEEAAKMREQIYKASRKKQQRAGEDYPHLDTCQVRGRQGWQAGWLAGCCCCTSAVDAARAASHHWPTKGAFSHWP